MWLFGSWLMVLSKKNSTYRVFRFFCKNLIYLYGVIFKVVSLWFSYLGLSSARAIMPCVLWLYFYTGIWASVLGLIISLGPDFWVCLCWMGLLFLGFSFLLVFQSLWFKFPVADGTSDHAASLCPNWELAFCLLIWHLIHQWVLCPSELWGVFFWLLCSASVLSGTVWYAVPELFESTPQIGAVSTWAVGDGGRAHQ